MGNLRQSADAMLNSNEDDHGSWTPAACRRLLDIIYGYPRMCKIYSTYNIKPYTHVPERQAAPGSQQTASVHSRQPHSRTASEQVLAYPTAGDYRFMLAFSCPRRPTAHSSNPACQSGVQLVECGLMASGVGGIAGVIAGRSNLTGCLGYLSQCHREPSSKPNTGDHAAVSGRRWFALLQLESAHRNRLANAQRRPPTWGSHVHRHSNPLVEDDKRVPPLKLDALCQLPAWRQGTLPFLRRRVIHGVYTGTG